MTAPSGVRASVESRFIPHAHVRILSFLAQIRWKMSGERAVLSLPKGKIHPIYPFIFYFPRLDQSHSARKQPILLEKSLFRRNAASSKGMAFPAA
jgi:hypothetical protein